MKIFFIDGYNVINSWPELKKLMEVNIEAARIKLIDMLQNYASYMGCKINLIFDGHLIPNNNGSKDEYPNVKVVYTKTGETADSFIEKSINNLGRKIEVSVVTSDNLEQQVIFQRGATRMSSIEFHIEIKSAEQNIRKQVESRYSEKRNQLEDYIEESVLKKLEKIRRSH